jgi:hypothetical protein
MEPRPVEEAAAIATATIAAATITTATTRREQHDAQYDQRCEAAE